MNGFKTPCPEREGDAPQKGEPLQNRRDFIGCAASLAALGLAKLALPAEKALAEPPATVRPRRVHRALVAWFSQTGNTGRIGRIIAAELNKAGVRTRAGEIRELSPADLQNPDLIVAGCPVNYYDVPPAMEAWLKKLPRMAQTPVAAFVTHGTPPGNQRNTGLRLLDGLKARGGAPLGLATFGHMGTFPPSWAYQKEKVLKHKDLPNQATYQKARSFAAGVLTWAAQGRSVSLQRECTFFEIKRYVLTAKVNKLLVNEHYIDKRVCIGCGLCMKKCPTGSIDQDSGRVNSQKCISCMGCINNCPAGAVVMVYFGKKLTGFRQFIKENHIQVPEPVL